MTEYYKSDRLHPDDIKEIAKQVIDGLLAAKKARKPRQAKAEGYTQDFERCWEAYPSRPNNNKRDAFKSFQRRKEDGVLPVNILNKTVEYAKYCEATEKAGTELVLQASTFYGPSKRYEDDFTIPKSVTKLTLPRNNDDLIQFAKDNDLPGPNVNESWPQYRKRLELEIEKRAG